MARKTAIITASTLVVALALAGPIASAEPASKGLTFGDAQAEGHYESATRFFEDGQLAAAEQELGLAYAIEPLPALLLLRLRILDMLGRCEEGAPLADVYLASGPDEAGRAMVEALVAECRRRSEATTTPATQEPAAPPVEASPRPPRHPLGGVLIGVGAAALVAGLGLELGSLRELRRAEESDLHDAYDAHRRTARTVQGIGAAPLTVGVALVIGGILHIRAIRRRASDEATPTTWVIPTTWVTRAGAGAGLIGRF